MPQVPASSGYQLETALPGFGRYSFDRPIALVSPPGDRERLFVVQLSGIVLVVTNLAAPTRTTFLDIRDRVRSGIPYENEDGMLGMVFHPGYATNGLFFVSYSVDTTSAAGSGRHQRLSRFRVSTTNPNQALTNEVVLLDQYDRAFNHNGGDLAFGNDGFLYYSLGDEGAANDVFANGQRIDLNFFAGMLRLDVDNQPGSLLPNRHPANTNNHSRTPEYRVPADNPWVGATQFNNIAVNPSRVRTEFYAVGLRNPWRFWIDRETGLIWCGDVGQSSREELNLIRRGGNYGWSHREGTLVRTLSGGIELDNPIHEYGHGTGPFQGQAVIGGRIYRGDKLPELHGSYIFGDFGEGGSGRVWSLRYNGATVTSWNFLLNEFGISAFGEDPRNGDILIATVADNTIKRLVYSTNTDPAAVLPPTLAQTGAFADLASLTPSPGMQPFDVNSPLWSDGALKRRWMCLPDTNLALGFSRDGNWSFPTGMVWVKHFELELTNGVAESRRRLETRLLVRNPDGVYGVTYRWGSSLTNALLVPDEGLDETFVVNRDGIIRTQVWHYPSRSECLSCHTPLGGFALGVNTHQLNRDGNLDGLGTTNQLEALVRSGYLHATNVPPSATLPRLVSPDDESWSAEWRVRSYLAANCAYCHQPGSFVQAFWDARPGTPTPAAGLIHGSLLNSLGNPSNRVVLPGSLEHSVLYQRVSTRGLTRMPPLGSGVTDPTGLALLRWWITNDLPRYRSYPEWQAAHFGSTNAPQGARSADPDGDAGPNYLEFLTGSDPLVSGPTQRLDVRRTPGGFRLSYSQTAARGYEIEVTSNPSNPASWKPLVHPNNVAFYSAVNRTNVIDLPDTRQAVFFRLRVYEP